MDKKLSKYSEMIQKDYNIFLNFLKAKFPLFHNSNLFFRDFHYGVKRFLEKKEIEITYPEAELIAKDLGDFFERETVFIRVNSLGWRLNYPEFVTTTPGDPL